MLFSISELRKVQSGDVLLKEGDVNSNVHLVLSGLLRSYVINSSGDEKTVLISKENMRAASLNSFLHKRPSEITIEAIEPSTILIINSNLFQQAIISNENLALLEKQGMRSYLIDATERLHLLTVLSPEERFIRFRDEHPDLIQRVPQMYLASYLGVTTVSLSRIKSRIAKQG
ncbi:MAG: Crp/Fnr family transcriptional regulator [Flavobacteriales bacterium]|nr:Crp/Fnr family transcriptional regulator [Flavobacteriales bacterium]